MSSISTARIFVITLALAALLSGSAKAGLNIWTSNGPFPRESIPALAIDPITPSTLYAGIQYLLPLGGSGGGVFKSTNSGASWSAINNGLPNTDIRALAIDPITPSTLYAGAGNFDGVFKSTNSGASWSAINNGLPNTDIRALAIDPITPSTLYAGAYDAGVFKSTNSGASWSAINNGLTDTDEVWALAIDPITPSTLYAGILSPAPYALGGGVFKSTDSGASWSAINNGLPNSPVRALAIDPITPSTLYAGTFAVGVFKSEDSGASWSEINNLLTSTHILALAIDPITPSTLYAGTFVGGVFKSTDSGASWSEISNGLTHPSHVSALAIDPITPSIIYAGTWYYGVFERMQVGFIFADGFEWGDTSVWFSAVP